jgi:hypothetical protein
MQYHMTHRVAVLISTFTGEKDDSRVATLTPFRMPIGSSINACPARQALPALEHLATFSAPQLIVPPDI